MRSLPTLAICAVAVLLGSAVAVDAARAPRPRLVSDINPYPEDGSDPSVLTEMGGALFFGAATQEHGRELWTSRGTRRSTVMVRDIYPGPDWGLPVTKLRLAVVDDRLFFTGDDGEHGAELWTSDGSYAGTIMVRDIQPGSGSSYPGGTYAHPTLGFGALGQILLFGALGADGHELWRSDGTEAGTWQVKDIRPGDESSHPGPFAVLDGVAYFSADDGSTGRELWRSDGTADGTFMVTELRPGPEGGDGESFTTVGDRVFFVADDGIHGAELWTTDGTAAGTSLVRDISPGPNDRGPSSLRASGGTLFFFADDETHGTELWRSDGSEAGTVLVRAVSVDHTIPFQLTPVAGAVYFSADDGVHGRELWRSDGTEAGTELIDIDPGERGSFPNGLTEFQGAVYFNVRGRLMLHQGRWSRPRATLGPRFRLGPELLIPVGGSLFFNALDLRYGRELWVYQPISVAPPAPAAAGSSTASP